MQCFYCLVFRHGSSIVELNLRIFNYSMTDQFVLLKLRGHLPVCVLLQIFRKEPFFYGHDNYDQLVKIARVSVVCEVVASAPDRWVMCVWEIIQYCATLGTWLCCKCILLKYLVSFSILLAFPLQWFLCKSLPSWWSCKKKRLFVKKSNIFVGFWEHTPYSSAGF